MGEGAYSQFGALANVFHENGPGLLIHPVWQATSAYFVTLRLEQEPLPNYVRYSFSFWEDVDYYSGAVQSEPVSSIGGTSSGASAPLSAGASGQYQVVQGGHPVGNCPEIRSVAGDLDRTESPDQKSQPDPAGRRGEGGVTGYVFTAQGTAVQLPAPVAWTFQYTAGIPCDSFRLRCIWEGENAVDSAQWATFQALESGEVKFTGVIDECETVREPEGSYFEISGRGMAARLLDNEALSQDYEIATLADILRDHVTPYGISVGGNDRYGSGIPVLCGRREQRVVGTVRLCPVLQRHLPPL